MIEPRIRVACESAYARYHHQRFIAPDPLELVRAASPGEREVTALLASCLALGRVDGILAAIRDALQRLQRLDDSVTQVLLLAEPDELRDVCDGFVYRFFDGEQLAAFFTAVGRSLRTYGSLQSLFAAHCGGRSPDEPDRRVIHGLIGMVDELRRNAGGPLEHSILLAQPEKGSACKRLLLFLRWMVRRDAIDPGGWEIVDPAELLVPVDTHMHSIARCFGLSLRSQPSLQSSREITRVFREITPEDPVRFDFALTRLGIHPDLDKNLLFELIGYPDSYDFATL